MKDKKGFTLIEIIAAVIILGIISIIAIITYTGSMNEFRDSYYSSLEKTMVEAGREFFSDNRTYRPSSVFESQKVPISLLESKAYINDIKDYNGKKCDRSSYVIAIKNGKNDFIYHACLVCSEDTFANTEDLYCNSSWDDNTTISPSLKTLDDKYVYKNTPKEKLREMLATKISIVKYDKAGNELASIDGTGLDEVPTILPENIDTVDTSKIGVYQVTYKYNDSTTIRNVHVYENGAPSVTIKKKNVYAKTIAENTVTEDTLIENYGTDDWAQELLIEFNAGANFHSEIGEDGVKAATYQWNKDGYWTTLCTVTEANGTCTTNVAQEMNENIKFRSVDTAGNISSETPERTLKIDRTAPSCTLGKSGTTVANDWYITNVTVNFSDKKDNASSLPAAKSGLGFYQIRRGSSQYNSGSRTSNESMTLSDETGYVTYYGFVEDLAMNYAKCSVQVRKDSVAPTCSITGHSKLSCSDSTSKLVSVYFGTSSNLINPSSLNYLSSWEATPSVTSPGTYTFKATDHAGKEYSTNIYYYTVTYNKNGGDTNPNPASSVVRAGQNADLSQVIKKAGYKMIGWNTSSTATNALSSYEVNGNANLYAIFQGCGKGYYTNDSGTGCIQCPEGYRQGAQAGSSAGCVKETVTCPAGQYLPANSSTCTTCPANSYCPGGTFRIDEGGGIYSCSAGLVSPAGSTSSSACDYPTVTCSAGQYLPANSSTCTSCPANSYCPGGSFKTNAGGGKTSCPSGMVSSAGSTSSSACDYPSVSCSAGNYLPANSSTCTKCPANSYCPGGSFKTNTGGGKTACPSGSTSSAGSDAKNDCHFNASPSKYTKVTITCNKSYTYFFKSAAAQTITGVTSCGNASFSCNSANYQKVWDDCTTNYNTDGTIKNYTLVRKTCTRSAKYTTTSSAVNNQTSCTVGTSFTCDEAHVNSSYVSECQIDAYSCPSGTTLKSGNVCYYN